MFRITLHRQTASREVVMAGWVYDEAPIWLVAAFVILWLLASAGLGMYVRRKRRLERGEGDEGAEQLIMSAVLGLLALLLGFTFILAVDRYDARRALVVEEANAIGTAWLRAQLLDEPHRTRMSLLFQGYAENRLQLAQAQHREERMALLARTDLYHQRLWTATVAAVRPIRHLEISSDIVQSVNTTIDIAAARKAARRARVPPRVLLVLLVYMGVTAYAVGYSLLRFRVRWAGGVLMVLLTLSYLLILDIDNPTRGGLREPQGAMEDLVAAMRTSPPPSFGP
jgi:hypothetical protein